MNRRARAAMDAVTTETTDALDRLLEDERANVEALVALTSMATDSHERLMLVRMGGQAVQACSDLHERLEQLGAPIGMRVGGGVHWVLAPERIDDRLRAFGEQQQELAERIEALFAAELDAPTRALLAELRAMLLAHAAWAIHHADEFAASRQIEPERGPTPYASLPYVETESEPAETTQPPEREDQPVPATLVPPLGPEPSPEPAIRPAEPAEPAAAAEPGEPSTPAAQVRRPAARGRPRRARWPAGGLERQNGDPA